jgi:hypothetical protein
MFKSSQKIFSAVLIAFLFIFLFITPNSTKACEEEPQSLLSLYLYSDLIVLAEIDSSNIIKREDESEYGYSVQIERNLKIIQILKGQPSLKNVSFVNYEFRENPNAQISSDEMMDIDHSFYDRYVDISKIKSGDKYLFFLTKDEENKNYVLTDYNSAIKDVSGKLDIYEKSVAELKAISESKEGQMERLAEWIVKSIEEPETRQDGISDLSESFYSLEYVEENADKQNKPFVFDKTFTMYESKIAQTLSDSQKSRISGVLYPMLQEAWFSSKPQYVHYGTAVILGSFNKSRLAIYSYNMLKSVEKKDTERKQIIMGFLIDVVGDTDLSEIYYEFSRITSESDSKKAKTTEELKAYNALKVDTLKKFDKRFEMMLYRNFKPFPEKS